MAEQVMAEMSMEPGGQVRFTKGYPEQRGTILEPCPSDFPFFLIRLDNGLRIVAGPSAFQLLPRENYR